MLTQLMIYVVSKWSELCTKASLRTAQAPIVAQGKFHFKGRSPEGRCYSVTTTCCTIARCAVTGRGPWRPPHLPVAHRWAPFGTRSTDRAMPLCQLLSFAPVYVLGSRETRALWKRLTQPFMLFTLPTPHFFRAGEGRGVLRNQKSAEVFKPLLHQSSFYKPLVIPTNISQQAASTAHIKPEKIP